jgi:valyl-tRNA synthetase
MSSTSREPLPKAYDPSSVEGRLYAWWESSGYFKPTIDPAKTPFTVMMPPPNVTGELHLGHALTAAVEDALVRYHRMLGDPTLWLPGADHAGIATQMVVERSLAAEGTTRQQLGREEFLRRVWGWVDHYGGTIDNQHRRLGASCDWSRKHFTLDPGPSRAVRTTFKRLYDKGLIYRGERMINWDPALHTVVSDLEVDHLDVQGSLYYLRYLYEGGGGHVIVATTRPETLLGDTAVAVNPTDDRYHGLIGKNVILPVLGRLIPVIADEAVDIEFGTGALKVTPGHDPSDYETGQRHGLGIVSIMNGDGTLNGEAGSYAGMDRFEARGKIVEQLDREGLLERIEPYQHSVGHSQRSGVVIEPLVSTQWFIDIAPLAGPAIEAVTSGRIQIVPERFSKVYLNWMENIRDWCISRQLWWGHRIPVWYCAACQHVTVSVDDPSSCEACGSTEITQDEDVLDTWFSSGLWTHSTLGWPGDTKDLRYFYPTALMETGYDILFFWVARMIMMGIENMGDVPFRTVYLHGLVRDAHGHKMSKTRGNVVDPLLAADKYGTDAVRFALGTGSAPGNDMRLSEDRMESARNFANKLWNAARFVLGSLPEAAALDGWAADPPRVHREDRWVLGRLDEVTAEVRQQWDDLQLGEAQRTVHDFVWSEFCDWYLELAKVRLRAGDDDPRRVLAHVLERSLRLLHPFMPFVTEELWQHLTAALPDEASLPASIMIAPYPEPSANAVDASALAEMALVTEVVRAIRNIRAEFHIEPSTKITPSFYAPDSAQNAALQAEHQAVAHLAGASEMTYPDVLAGAPTGDSIVSVVVRGVTIRFPLAGVNVEAEMVRLRAESDEAERYLIGLEARLANEQFLAKAPDEVVEKERQRLDDGRARQARLHELLAELAS